MIRVVQRAAQLVVERPALRQLLLESYGADGGLPDEPPPRTMQMPTAADVDALAARLIVGWAGWGA